MKAPSILPFLRIPEPPLKAATVDMLRAYLLTASLAATLVEFVILVAIVVFGCSQETFESTGFRLTVMLILLVAVLVTRQIAGATFRSAVAHHYATFSGVSSETVTPQTATQTVTLSPTCPRRPLVVLHLRLSRRLFELAER
ncbi:hypothetical protein [Burkholderia sp. L27(2015)]|jgi:hypothetical protein|uniref:hypothetical protein n=1 Tax=Burkholderia sp. L27(2015) TaxID=1641858 RepID=UPI00131D2594|nr:hypothetical protein [Burkholderia sp. L27(2015)]